MPLIARGATGRSPPNPTITERSMTPSHDDVDTTRRHAIHGLAAAGLAAAIPGAVAASQPADDAAVPGPDLEGLTRDQQAVVTAGMTRDEAEAWTAAAAAAGAFFALPELHPSDRQEVATAIHVLQNKLLARPTYRKYLETAKALHGG